MIKDVYEDKKRPVPEAFRVSLDPSDAAAHERLQKADGDQRLWSVGVTHDFASQTPHERLRQKAVITIETLELAATENGLTKDQLEVLAESYACVGRYDRAAHLSLKNKELYEKYWHAVYLDDSEWCEHPSKHKYVKETVWSVRDGAEMKLLACNVCGVWNVQDSPEFLQAASQRRSAIRTSAPDPGKSTIHDLIAWHHANVRR